MKELLQSYLGENELNYVDMCRRVAKAIGGNPVDEALFFESLIHKEFIASSMILLTAGKEHPCLCSDVAIPWSEKEHVSRALKHGLGVSLHLPNNEPLEGVYDFLMSFKEISQRDFRPGATMLTCNDTHPDIEEFIQLKNKHRDLTHVNFSVLCTGKETLQKISPAAHACGDPGFINRSLMGSDFIAPCGQNALFPWQSIPYAHINLAAHVDKNVFDVRAFLETLALVKKFLEKCLEKHTFLSDQNKQVSFQEKRIGIGVVGLQELISKLDVSYDDTQVLSLLSFIGSALGVEGVISPTGATSQLLHLTPNIEPANPLSISWQKQLLLAATLQKWIHGAISKTILLPETASLEEVQNIFSLAWDLNLKGLTVYRINSLEK